MFKSEQYRVTIHSDGKLYKLYRTAGSVAINASHNPMVDSARALLAAGAEPTATLSGCFDGAAISAMPLHRLARAYAAPKVNHRAADPSRNAD
jgi:hypothetical protein